MPEIQVFTVESKGADVSDDILTAIDLTVHFPIIFEVTTVERVRMVAAQKSLHGKTPSIGAYFATDWRPISAPRRPPPASLDLPSLYEAILTALLPLEMRAGESVAAATDRLGRSRKLEREIAALGRKLRTEPQLNRKFEIRRQIKERTTLLAELTDVPSKKE